MFHYSQSQKSNRVEGNTFDYEHDVVAAILYNHLVICISIMRRSQHFSMNSFIIRWIVNKYKRKYIVDYQRKKALLKRGNQKIIKYHSNVLKIYLDIIRFYIYNSRQNSQRSQNIDTIKLTSKSSIKKDIEIKII